MPRWVRLLVGALLSLFLLGVFATGVQFVYTRYAKPAESSLVQLLQYLFKPREEPKQSTPAPDMVHRMNGKALGDPPKDLWTPTHRA